MPAASSRWEGTQVRSMTCSMAGLGAWGVRKNQMAEARLSQESATSPGLLRSTEASPSNMASEKAP